LRERAAQRQRHGESRPQRSYQPQREPDPAARERVHLVSQLSADHRDPAERGVHDVVAQGRVALEDEAEDRHEREQQWEQREERVVRDQRRQVRPVVLAELLHDRNGEAPERMPALPGVDRRDEAHALS
jgi:uncharacterized protein YhaN